MMRFFDVVLWIILCMAVVDWCCFLLTSRDTMLNIVAVVIFYLWITLSYEIYIFIKKKKKRK